MIRKLLIFATAIALPMSTAYAKESKQIAELYSMTPDDFAAAVYVKDDALETDVSLNTANAFQETHGLLKIVWSDIFLRAFIAKSSGATTYQVYAKLLYAGPSWPRFERANFAMPAGSVRSVDLLKIGSDVDCSLSRYTGGCSYTETVGFDLSEEDIKALASSYDPTKKNAMQIRFKGQAGVDLDMILLPAEAAGILKALEAQRVKYAGNSPGK